MTERGKILARAQAIRDAAARVQTWDDAKRIRAQADALWRETAGDLPALAAKLDAPDADDGRAFLSALHTVFAAYVEAANDVSRRLGARDAWARLGQRSEQSAD